jgi:Flp pilus assembly pilin Flp
MLTYVSSWHCKKWPPAKSRVLLGRNGLDSSLRCPDRIVKLRTGTIANYGETNRLTEDTGMDKITGLFVKVREYQKGQTMAEYALIMAAVAVVVFVGYQTMGTTITSLLTTVDGKL